MTNIQNNPHLLKDLLAGSKQTTPLWKPTNYWEPYCKRISDELDKNGLQDFRDNQRLLKGFASGGILLPGQPRAAWKKLIWNTTKKLPVVRTILGEYKHINTVYYRTLLDKDKMIAKLVLDDVAKKFPNLKIPKGFENVGGADCFQWNNHTIPADWVIYLSRIADFYTKVPPEEVTSIAEIGPGIGLSSLAHIALNPHIKVIVNIDIVPVIYISGQYYRSMRGLNVIDYQKTKNQEEIDIAPEDQLKIYCLPPWELEKVSGKIDFFFNAYSFQEMEKEVCQNYTETLLKLIQKGVMLHSHVTGHAPQAGGQKEPVTLSFLKDLFINNYPKTTKVDGVWPQYYNGDVEETCLMRA